MIAHDAIQDLVTAIGSLTGAEQVSAVLHSAPLERQSLRLAHSHDNPEIPEFASESALWRFVSQHESGGAALPKVATFSSEHARGCLVRVAFNGVLENPSSDRRDLGERRREPDFSAAPGCDGAIWIGILGGDPQVLIQALTPESPDAAARPSPVGLLLSMAWRIYHLSRLVRDPVSQLPGRMQLQVFVKRAIAALWKNRQSLSLMLINPDDFTMINHRFGRGRGDEAVREIAALLRKRLRSTDGLFHYGGAVFAAVLPATDLEQCRTTANKMQALLTENHYLDGQVRLTFSIGAAVAHPENTPQRDDLQPQLTRRADFALNGARLSGGARVIVSDVNDSDEQFSTLSSPLRGMFTADTEKDYRNMLLLWETVSLISSQTEPAAIASEFVERLAICFRPDQIALLSTCEGGIETLASNLRDESSPGGRRSDRPVIIDDFRRRVIDDALATRQVARAVADAQGKPQTAAYAVPLVARDNPVGCLLLDFRGRVNQLDSSDVVFLTALAAQLAVAMDRADLVQQWIRQKDQESRSLRTEVRGLRQALNHTQMIYHSAEMHRLMDTVKRVAPSDATVLIIGQSGTGKEMLAQSVHQMSDRAQAPFVVFDCGAVAHNLLEAQLFGHRKGAFTGADRSAVGSIAAADGGTLFLDEIGELPLELQAKLLRFVQEKEFAPVGSTERRRVDVRIVAATNRELQDEVAAGRFRGDLYYRLRVIALQAVPLRDRRDDILPLANFFLQKYSAQQRVATPDLSDSARQKLLDYHWPGNVRELEHCILRAVLTHGGETLGAESIELFPESGSAPALNSPLDGPVSEVKHLSEAIRSGPAEVKPCASADPWDELGRELEGLVQIAVEKDLRRPMPLGRWLNEDLVLTANQICDNVARQAAQLIRLPESTFRRQLDKASYGQSTGANFRPEEWANIRPLLKSVVTSARHEDDQEGSLLDRARDCLLAHVRVRTERRPTAGASLMGVTPPTYRRWLRAQESHQ